MTYIVLYIHSKLLPNRSNGHFRVLSAAGLSKQCFKEWVKNRIENGILLLNYDQIRAVFCIDLVFYFQIVNLCNYVP